MGMPPGEIEWRLGDTPVDYRAAVEEMERRVAAIRAGTAAELVWLLEHPPIYTAGTSAREEDLLEPGRLPIHRTGRGGQYTYHGPGQRIAYVMLDLRKRGQDVRCYVHQLEEWIIRVLARFDVRGERRVGRVGIWVARPGGRGNRSARAAMGDLSRRCSKPRSGSRPLPRYRALRDCRARRDLARPARGRRDDGGGRRSVAKRLRRSIRGSAGVPHLGLSVL